MLTQINGKDLWLETSGDGPTVVMVHGLGGTTTFYDAVTARLADDHRVVAFDLNGHGRSPLTGAVSIESFADDLRAVLDHVGADTATVIGHSMGTAIAQTFTAQNPDRVDKLVLLGPIRELPDAGRDGLRQRAVNVRADTIGSIATAIADAGTGPKTKAERPEIVGYVRECILRQTDEGYAVACEAAAGTVDADQAAITCPVLLITGTADGIAPPEKTQHIAAGFGDATVHVIDGIGHWTVVESGAEVASLVAEFLG